MSLYTQYEVRLFIKLRDASAFFFATILVLFAAACLSSLDSSAFCFSGYVAF
jgi:hypothetical protein